MTKLRGSVALAFLAAACGQSPPVGVTPGARATACETPASWIAGTTELCNGALVYRDYLYDDHGADTVPGDAAPVAPLSPAAGDARYPEGAENTADLVTLTLQPDGDRLRVTAELNTLYAPDSTVVALAIDTDNDPATGGGDWEGLGIRSDGWDVLQTFTAGDPATNLIAGDLPLPGGATWRVQAVVAQADGTVMNVAFRGSDETVSLETSTWWETKQATALAAGDISEFGEVVDVAALASGADRAAAVTPGLHQRVYTSRYTLPPGEGVGTIFGRHGDTGATCEQEFNFFGKYQPYGIYIPDQAGPHGIQFALHGCSANHASLIDGAGMQGRFGEDLNRIILVPLGRGPTGYYSDISERDVLDVLADVIAHYPIDRERIFMGGYSMGGYGTLRLASLYPDLWAGAVNWVGFTGDAFNTPLPGNPGAGDGNNQSGAIGNVIDFVGNLRHVPTASLYAGEDELVHTTSWTALRQAFADAAGVVYEFFMHPAAEHLTFAIADDWAKEAAYSAPWTRVRDPQRVTFRTQDSLAYPEYGLAHDRAYWVSGIAGADPEKYSDIDLESRACTNETPQFATGNREGADPVPWVSDYRTRTGATEEARARRLEGTLANVARLTIDAAATCLEGGTVAYAITTDGPVTLRLSDGRQLTLGEAGTHQGVF